jgi:Lrp/AsnC family leucine-responsive transcriptional regulator
MIELDTIDKNILYQLDLNSRQTISNIGKKINLSKANVGYRIKRLQEWGVIKNFYTVIDTFKLGYTSQRFYIIFENINQDIEKKIINYFINNKYTWWVGRTSGRFDLVVIIWVRGINEFYNFWEKTLFKYRKYFAQQIFSPYTQLLHYRFSFLLDNYPKKDREDFEITGGGLEVEYDALDFNILNLLASDSRIQIVKMIERLHVSGKNIRDRIKRLMNLGVIQGFRVHIDYSKLGYKYFKVDIDLTDYLKIKKIVSYIKKNPYLVLIDRSVGFADLELEFYVKSFDHLNNIMADLINMFPDAIKNYKQFFISKIYKSQYIPEI